MIVEKMKPGLYVIAVSGGVDSVVLLNLMNSMPGVELIVAHFDHGIRPNSARDKQFVESLAKDYNLMFVSEDGKLGTNASEEKARLYRYKFLKNVVSKFKAEAIITAHHQDDVLETAILNLIRGTGRRGLTSLKSNQDILRPLLKVPKSELIKYAKSHKLPWNEDETNLDDSYKRNYVRHQIVEKLSKHDRSKLLGIITDMKTTNDALDGQLAEVLQITNNQLDRQWFNTLPHVVAKEVLIEWLRGNKVYGYDKNGLEKLVTNLKTSVYHRKYPVNSGTYIEVTKDSLALV